GTVPLRQVITDQNEKPIPNITTHVQSSERSVDLFSDDGMHTGVIHDQVHRGLPPPLALEFLPQSRRRKKSRVAVVNQREATVGLSLALKCAMQCYRVRRRHQFSRHICCSYLASSVANR
ncbi:MAG: hypothetical protein ABWX63_06605, partial [Paeniglutamicibacter terrestris]